jgi:hypothetical protein
LSLCPPGWKPSHQPAAIICESPITLCVKSFKVALRGVLVLLLEAPPPAAATVPATRAARATRTTTLAIRPRRVLYQLVARTAEGRGAAAGRRRAWLPLLCDFFFPFMAIAGAP